MKDDQDAFPPASDAEGLAPARASQEQHRSEGLGPIIILSYEHAGDESLRSILATHRSLVCTSGTGILPACHSAAEAWRAIEPRHAWPSGLARQSMRAMANVMVTIIQANAGATRWCETAFAAPAAAETFLWLFPSTTVLCLYRSLEGVLVEGLATYAWGLGGSPFWPYSRHYQGNSVATIATYWVERTELLLAFEEHEPSRAVRIRSEDITDNDGRVTRFILQVTGLDNNDAEAHLVTLREPRRRVEVPDLAQQLRMLPQALQAKIRDLHARLGYELPW